MANVKLDANGNVTAVLSSYAGETPLPGCKLVADNDPRIAAFNAKMVADIEAVNPGLAATILARLPPSS
jgi:hypothetical protein